MPAIERFGASAPAADIFREFGFSAAPVAELARGVLPGRAQRIAGLKLHEGRPV